MKGIVIGIIGLVLILWLATYILSHSYIIMSVGPIMLFLAAAFIVLFFYVKFRIGRHA